MFGSVSNRRIVSFGIGFPLNLHRKGAKDAKMRASLAELTEEAEGEILFACPEEFSGQAKRLFWRIGERPILQK
jgi:hypothetical protein